MYIINMNLLVWLLVFKLLYVVFIALFVTETKFKFLLANYK